MNRHDSKRVVVIGAGGHAKVVLATLQACGYAVSMIVDDDPAKWGRNLLGVPVHGGTLELLHVPGVRAVIAVGDNAAREAIAERLRDVEWLTLVHPGAYVHPSVHIDPGTVVFAGAVIQPDSRIGAHVIVNTTASVDHDCIVGDCSHLAPGVHLAGNVRVGRGAFLGIGSVVAPGLRIGDWTTVGAGAVVVTDLPDRVTAVGTPARPLAKENV